jgi:MFS superfamily sulfate permease-like transporter
MRKIYAQRPAEFWVALITALVVIFIGVEQGIILAIILSLLLHTRHGYRPKNIVLAQEDGHLRAVPAKELAEALPGLIVYRFSHDMYYANAETLGEELLGLLKAGPEPVSWLCVDMAAVDDVDFSAAATLREASLELKDRGVQLLFSNVSDHVREQLDVSGITEVVEEDSYYPNIDDVIKAYQQKSEAG